MQQLILNGLTLGDLLAEVRNIIKEEISDFKTSTPTVSKFLDVAQAAEFLHVKKQTIYQNIEKIPHLKKHGKLLFVESDLRDYLLESEVRNA
jgi:hypothetical protein